MQEAFEAREGPSRGGGSGKERRQKKAPGVLKRKLGKRKGVCKGEPFRGPAGGRIREGKDLPGKKKGWGGGGGLRGACSWNQHATRKNRSALSEGAQEKNIASDPGRTQAVVKACEGEPGPLQRTYTSRVGGASTERLNTPSQVLNTARVGLIKKGTTPNARDRRWGVPQGGRAGKIKKKRSMSSAREKKNGNMKRGGNSLPESPDAEETTAR